MPPEPAYPRTTTGLLDALTALGTTEGAVAENLYRMGFTGCAMDGDHCPVANYVHARLDVPAVHATRYRIRIWWHPGGDAEADEERLFVPTPVAVAGFIRAFDDGGYTFLTGGSDA